MSAAALIAIHVVNLSGDKLAEISVPSSTLGKELIHRLKELIPNPLSVPGCVVLNLIFGQHKLERGFSLADQKISPNLACSCLWTEVSLAQQSSVVNRYCSGGAPSEEDSET